MMIRLEELEILEVLQVLRDRITNNDQAYLKPLFLSIANQAEKQTKEKMKPIDLMA